MSETLIILSAGAICLALIMLCKPRATDEATPAVPEAEVKRLRRGYFALWQASLNALSMLQFVAPDCAAAAELGHVTDEAVELLFDLSQSAPQVKR